MQEFLYKVNQKWIKLSNLGVSDDLSVEEVIRTRLLNMIFFIALTWSFSLLVVAIVLKSPNHFTIILATFLAKLVLFALNASGRQSIARYIFIIFFSTYVPLFWLFVDSAWGFEFVFLIIIFLTLILFPQKEQRFIVAYQCFLFIGASFLIDYIPDGYKNKITPFPYVTEYSFIFYVTFSTFVFAHYQKEIKKYRLSQIGIIQDLKDNNLHFEKIQEKIGQFTEVVSKTLLTQSLVVRQQIDIMNVQVIHNEHIAIKATLNKTLAAAQKMYFWVNDILELSSFRDISSSANKSVDLNKTLQTVKENLADIAPNIEQKITADRLPTININEAEIFIVFYNLLHTFLSKEHTQENLTIRYIRSNKGIILYFYNKNEGKNLQSLTFLQSELKLSQLLVHGWNGKLSYISNENQNTQIQVQIPILSSNL